MLRPDIGVLDASYADLSPAGTAFNKNGAGDHQCSWFGPGRRRVPQRCKPGINGSGLFIHSLRDEGMYPGIEVVAHRPSGRRSLPTVG
jgi:hypothetical protein